MPSAFVRAAEERQRQQQEQEASPLAASQLLGPSQLPAGFTAAALQLTPQQQLVLQQHAQRMARHTSETLRKVRSIWVS